MNFSLRKNSVIARLRKKKKYLEQMIEQCLKLAEAYALGLDREPDIAER
jgi:hypothetical protein